MTYGWKGTVAEFLAGSNSLPRSLAEAHGLYYHEMPGISQRTAWDHELPILANAFTEVPRSSSWGLVMEYELPFEGGRRVDKVTLAAENVLALEFKDATQVKRADLDQVRAYARDLSEYHSACRDRRVEPVLVLARATDTRLSVDGTTVTGVNALPQVLDDLAGHAEVLDVDDWLRGTYAPLPSLIEAARRVFRDEPLPALRRAESARIPDLIAWLNRLVSQAASRSERHLVLITGVPGSGKTLVGLKFVHEFGEPGEAPALFLSGNGPLVQLLQYVLKSKVFVKPMRNFILEFGIRQKRVPSQNVIVFDEAQRAWDLDYVREKHNVEFSEPQMLLEIASRIGDWAVLIGLVGEGQEIHLGEEAGIRQWRTALDASPTAYQVHVPEHLSTHFTDAQVEPLLNLTLSLRTHSARHVQDWVAAIIRSDVEAAAALGGQLKADKYDIYVTTDLAAAKAYLWSRYADAPEKRFGLLASSKARNLPAVGIDNDYYAMQRLKIGPWYSAPPTDEASCCQLRHPATEFQSQGLELDLPIVCWGDDLAWEGRWVAKRATRKAKNSEQLRLNSYRVLLTRGRDGTIVFLPPNLADGQSDRIRRVFLEAGAQAL